MLRLVGFFLLVLCALQVLRHLPIVGAVFQIPLVGFWLAAVLVSIGMSKLAADALDRRKRSALIRQLGAVDTPHNKGKLGLLFLQQRRFAKALPLLEDVAGDDPDSAEWAYRLGQAYSGAGRLDQARVAFERAVMLNEEHAYGAARMRLAEALASSGDHARALACLERLELNHGPNPESAYRRGMALRALGRKPEAQHAFAEVSDLAQQMPKFQRRAATVWVTRAALKNWF